MKLVRFHPEAEGEAGEQEAWYRERSEVAAQGFLLELDAAVRAVAESRNAGLCNRAANGAMCFLDTPSPCSTAFVEKRSSSPQLHITAGVPATGVIANSRSRR